jgi:hypothetical protein
VVTAAADFTQTSGTPFTPDGTEYVLGHEGLTLHFTTFGQGTRAEPTEPRATVLYAGSATVISGTGGTTVTQTVGGGGTSGWTWVALVVAVLALLVAAWAVTTSRRPGSRG